jgi:hypothetical protein
MLGIRKRTREKNTMSNAKQLLLIIFLIIAPYE